VKYIEGAILESIECAALGKNKCQGQQVYRPFIFDWGALLYTPKQPARAQKCVPIKNEPSIHKVVN